MKRKALPQRRQHEAFNMTHWGVTYSVGLGRYKDGKIGEIFINTEKVGTQSDVLARDSAVILSIALQYGVPLDAFRHTIMRNADGKPSGPIGMVIEVIAADEAGTHPLEACS
jgi:hypothetical protein